MDKNANGCFGSFGASPFSNSFLREWLLLHPQYLTVLLESEANGVGSSVPAAPCAQVSSAAHTVSAIQSV